MKNSDFVKMSGSLKSSRTRFLPMFCNFALRAKKYRESSSHRDDSILLLCESSSFSVFAIMPISSRSVLSVLRHPQEQAAPPLALAELNFTTAEGRREIFPGKRNKIRHAFLFDLPRFPAPRHLSLYPPPLPCPFSPRHYLPLTSFPGLYYFLPSTMARLSHSLSLILSLRGRDRQSFPGKEASESIFRVNQAPPTPDVSSLAR